MSKAKPVYSMRLDDHIRRAAESAGIDIPSEVEKALRKALRKMTKPCPTCGRSGK